MVSEGLSGRRWSLCQAYSMLSVVIFWHPQGTNWFHPWSRPYAQSRSGYLMHQAWKDIFVNSVYDSLHHHKTLGYKFCRNDAHIVSFSHMHWILFWDAIRCGCNHSYGILGEHFTGNLKLTRLHFLCRREILLRNFVLNLKHRGPINKNPFRLRED